MFLVFVMVVELALVLLAGGRLSRLATLRVRHVWLVPAALGLQLLITEVFRAAGWVDATLHVVSYLLAGAFLVVNRRVPGLPLLGLGALSNAVTIALNGGTLPASARALRAAGVAPQAGDFTNSGVLAHPVLPWLGDVVATPSWLPFQNVTSVGDVLILAGAGWLLTATCGTRWSRGRSGDGDVPTGDGEVHAVALGGGAGQPQPVGE